MQRVESLSDPQVCGFIIAKIYNMRKSPHPEILDALEREHKANLKHQHQRQINQVISNYQVWQSRRKNNLIKFFDKFNENQWNSLTKEEQSLHKTFGCTQCVLGDLGPAHAERCRELTTQKKPAWCKKRAQLNPFYHKPCDVPDVAPLPKKPVKAAQKLYEIANQQFKNQFKKEIGPTMAKLDGLKQHIETKKTLLLQGARLGARLAIKENAEVLAETVALRYHMKDCSFCISFLGRLNGQYCEHQTQDLNR